MRRTIALLFCFVFAFSLSVAYAELPATADTAPVYDFKEFMWGDSKAKVMAVEGDPILEGKMDGMDATYIAYETRTVGLDMFLAYYFCDEGLYAVRYILNESHSNEELYIDDYESFKTALTKKYGEPIWDTEIWSNDSKKEYYADKKGDALCYGYLTYVTWYITDTTYISMSMDADNYEISMRVDYESKTISPGEADYSSDI